MPRRRRKKRRKRSDPMRKRMGLVGWRGSRPFDAWSKTLVTITHGTGHNPGTTSGTVFTLPVNNWNDPMGDLATLVAGSGNLIQNRHPVNHNNAIAAGYNIVQVLSWFCRLKVNWIKADDPSKDFFVAYTFSQNDATEVLLTAGLASNIERLEIFTNPRWTVKHMRAVQGSGEVHTNRSDIVINVPNVFKYCKIIADGSNVTTFGNGLMSHVIADTSAATNNPNIQLFCTVVIMTEDGFGLAIDSVAVTIAVTQKVRIMRDFLGAEDMDGGEVDVHA